MRANILGVHRLSAARGATLLVIHHHFGEQNGRHQQQVVR